MVIISQEAINDIATFYANTLIRYPNTWTQDMVDSYIEKTIKEMEAITIGTIQGQKTPILQHLNDGNTAELKTSNNKWYFSIRIQNENCIIENAWYYSNASNRAYRRGVSNSSVSLDDDDRHNQTILESLNITEFQIRQIIKESLKRLLGISRKS